MSKTGANARVAKRWQWYALANTQEVANVVKACVQAGVSIVPQGGNTGLVVGSIPDDSGKQVLLSLQRMHAVRAIDTDNLTLTVEAGCILQNCATSRRTSGFFVSTEFGFRRQLHHWWQFSRPTQVARRWCVTAMPANCVWVLEVVTAQGDIWHGLSGLRKDNTGYDLRNLMIGSEGTLGIITAATVKLFPMPAAKLTAWAAVPSVEHAVQLAGLGTPAFGRGVDRL